MAMTRALTLGRGASRITVVGPPNGTLAAADPSSATVDVAFFVDIDAFEIGREGSWCLVASDIGMVTCVLQRHLRLVLRVTPPVGCAAKIAFHAELKSNVYGDVLFKSAPVAVAVAPRTPPVPGGATDPPPAYPATEVLVWPYAPSC